MKKQTTRILVLAGVFIVSFIIFSFTTYKKQETQTTELAEATLPVIYFYNGDQRINESHGYTDRMDPSAMREGLVPVSADREIHFEADSDAYDIDRISYRVLNTDGSENIPETEIGSYTLSGNKTDVTFTAANQLAADTEYILELTLASGKEEVCYYTRILEQETDDTPEYIALAREFHEKTFEGDFSYFDDYLEATNGDTTTLNYVDLHCGDSQICWGGLEVTQESDPEISIWEINSSYTVLTLDYRVSAPDEEGNTAEYDVTEYYRLKQGSKRIIVLNFERTMNQIFTFETADVAEDGTINLGIRDTSVEYQSTEAGILAAFVQEGDLWSYDASSGNLTCIFTFRGDSQDTRNDYDQHEIRILQTTDGGNVDYMVYGYMNRGPHEGEVGIALMHYDGFVHLNEEQGFIPVDTSAQILIAELNDYLYEDENSNIYLILGESLYRISLENLKAELVLDQLTEDSYRVSDSGRYLAWVDSSQVYCSEVIHVLDLEEDRTRDIPAVLNYYVRPLAFLGSDLVYGTARQEEVGADGSGTFVYPMESVKVVDATTENMAEQKSFRKHGKYISSVNEAEGSIQLNLSELQDDVYVSCGVDAIMDQSYNDDTVLKITTDTETNREKVVLLKVNQSSDQIKVRQMKVQQVLQDNDPDINLPDSTEGSGYYVYVHGRIKLYTTDYCTAVLTANECRGIVTDQKQQNVWKRARATKVSTFENLGVNAGDGLQGSVTMCLSTVLRYEGSSASAATLLESGKTITEILEEEIPGATAFELEGADYDDVLYYVSQGRPVIAMTGPESAVVICGYNSETIVYYNPLSSSTSRLLYNTFDKLLDEGNGKFIVYYK